jgi:hypothetical protein
MTTATELINGVQGRWLGPRGIFCHIVPAVEDIDPKEWDNGMAHHTMVTAIAEWAPSLHGELIRSVDWEAGEVSYEARIDGIEDPDGICDIAAFTRNDLAALAKVANDLRYMWDAILDPEGRGRWSMWCS